MNEGHYYGYFRNFLSLKWWKQDDEDVEEVCEDVVLDDAYAGDSCAFMLQMSFKIQTLIGFAWKQISYTLTQHKQPPV